MNFVRFKLTESLFINSDCSIKATMDLSAVLFFNFY